MANYGAIMPQELTDNRHKLDEPYNPSNEPCQIVTNRVQQARNFAADGGLTITDAEAINSTLGVLEESGVLERAIEVWRDKPTAERNTWAMLKNHFQPRILQYQKTRKTTGAHYAHSIKENLVPEQLQHFMLSQESNANAVVNMATTQHTVIENLAAMQKAITDITQQLNNSSNNSGTTYQRRGGNIVRPPPTDNGSYCFTHGFLIHKDHNSGTCKHPGPGHKPEATRAQPNPPISALLL
jgi:hypothetical protein